MKKLFIFCLAVFLAGGLYGQGISGSAHDFSGQSGWTNQNGEICITCHTPHNAQAITGAPLWNHEVTATASFTLYSSSSLNAVDMGQPAGTSKLCLSCHDGTVAVDSFGGDTGSTMIGTGLVGTDLSNDHPVSFTYDAALATADGELHNPTNTNSGLGGFITADLLFAGKMECSSCHDVHNGAGIAKLLVKSNAGSALCLTCHDK